MIQLNFMITLQKCYGMNILKRSLQNMIKHHGEQRFIGQRLLIVYIFIIKKSWSLFIKIIRMKKFYQENKNLCVLMNLKKFALNQISGLVIFIRLMKILVQLLIYLNKLLLIIQNQISNMKCPKLNFLKLQLDQQRKLAILLYRVHLK